MGRKKGGREEEMIDVRVGGSGGREGVLGKGTSGTNETGTERGREGRRKGGRGAKEERGREGKLQGRYPEKDTGQYIHCTKQPTTRSLPLRLWCYKWKTVNEYNLVL